MLETIALCKSYRLDNAELPVFSDINLHVEKGEYALIYGESGSGKTTLLYILAGLERPTSGQVLLNKKDLYRLPDRKLSRFRNEKIGMIFQEFYLEEDLTVLENVLFPRYVQGRIKKKDEKKAQEMLEEVGILEKARVKARFLSGGQKQRVAIARALINDPDLVLADEPTANLDLKTGQDILDLLRYLNKKKNVTIILVTHEHKHLPVDKRFSLEKGSLVEIRV